MHLPRHTLSSQVVAPALVSATFTPSYEPPSQPSQKSQTGRHLLTCATRSGFLVAHTCPLKVVAKRDYLPDEGALSIACSVGDTSLLLLVGGGRAPRYAPNKVVIWDESAFLSRPDSSAQDIMQDSNIDSRTASTVFDAGSVWSSTAGLQESDVGSTTTSHDSISQQEQASSSGSTISDGSAHNVLPTPGSSDPHTHGKTPLRPQSRPHAAPKPPRTGREVMELEFDEAVKSICVRCYAIPSNKDSEKGTRTTSVALIAVVLKTKAVLFELGEHLTTLQSADGSQPGWGIIHRTTIPVLDDGRGLVDMVRIPGTRSVLLALSGRQPGHIQLVLLSMLSPRQSGSGVLASSIIAAHSGSLVSLCISGDGSLLATASSKGTLIRIWSTMNSSLSASSATKHRATVKAVLQHELRRGTEQASILSMAFTPDRAVLAAASDKGTIHFFNIAKHSSTGEGSGSSTPRANATPPSTIGLSKAASKYLPSTVNQLASQLPSNMIPQYLKSHWSTAQFRIKLRTFAAHSSEERAKRTSSSRRDGSSQAEPSTSDAPRGNAGVAKSTEGAWATLKGRIEDIRRWEPALDERIFLTWVSAPAVSEDIPTSTSTAPTVPYQLIALTSSGSWYRISLTDQADDGSDQEDTVLDMYKDSGSSRRRATRNRDGGEGTKLEEYQVLGVRDEWDV